MRRRVLINVVNMVTTNKCFYFRYMNLNFTLPVKMKLVTAIPPHNGPSIKNNIRSFWYLPKWPTCCKILSKSIALDFLSLFNTICHTVIFLLNILLNFLQNFTLIQNDIKSKIRWDIIYKFLFIWIILDSWIFDIV